MYPVKLTTGCRPEGLHSRGCFEDGIECYRMLLANRGGSLVLAQGLAAQAQGR